ncbi:MAG: histidine phosphatase family protein [Bacteroidota bacterium]
MHKNIYIVRHGQTDYNKLHIVQGSGVDSSLNETGRAQAMAFYNKYKAIDFDVVLTSKLVRTHQTMRHFIDDGLPWEQFGEINEMAWGIHEGKKSNPSMIAEYKAMTSAWQQGDYDARIVGGESALELSQRLNEFVNHLKTRSESNILVCSHGRAMRCLMTLLNQVELFRMDEFPHANTGLYLVNYQPDVFHFQLENDLSHLDD